MKLNHRSVLSFAVVVLLCSNWLFAQEPSLDSKQVKVFILAGQSNMEGYGVIRSLPQLGEHAKHGDLLAKLKSTNGDWKRRDDVFVYWGSREKKHGPLDTSWGAMPGESIGPELMLGTILGEAFEEPVLLIKTAWGGKSVWCDFRSPTAGEMTAEEKRILKRDYWLEPGKAYEQMVREIKTCLKQFNQIVPGDEDEGYELCGLAWFQGWNDYCEWHLQLDEKPVGLALIENYPKNLSAMLTDLRRELGAPDLPIVLGELGVGGKQMNSRAKNKDDHEAVAMIKFRDAQRKLAADPSLENITFVSTIDCWDQRLQQLREMSDKYWQVKQQQGIADTEQNHLPTKALNDEFLRRGGHWYCHYNGSAMSYCLVGKKLADALLKHSQP